MALFWIILVQKWSKIGKKYFLQRFLRVRHIGNLEKCIPDKDEIKFDFFCNIFHDFVYVTSFKIYAENIFSPFFTIFESI